MNWQSLLGFKSNHITDLIAGEMTVTWVCSVSFQKAGFFGLQREALLSAHQSRSRHSKSQMLLYVHKKSHSKSSKLQHKKKLKQSEGIQSSLLFVQFCFASLQSLVYLNEDN